MKGVLNVPLQVKQYNEVLIGVRDEFRWGGGVEVTCPNIVILSIACTKIKWVCPNITNFLPKNGYLKNSSPMPRTPMEVLSQEDQKNKSFKFPTSKHLQVDLSGRNKT